METAAAENGRVMQEAGEVPVARVGAGGGKRSSRLPSLDGLRAVSILMVLLDHTMAAQHGAYLKALPVQIAVALFANGGFGVQVFFVISGFLITHLLLMEQNKTGTISLKHFYIRRVFRICPAFYTLIALVGVLSAVHVFDAGWHDIFHAATFTWLYNFGNWNWYLAHSWSLSVEEQFYLFWPAALVVLGRRRGVWAAVVILLIMPFARLGSGMETSKMVHRLCYILSAGRFDLLMFGCLAAIGWQSRRFQEAIGSPLAGVVCGAAAGAAVFLSVSKHLLPVIAETRVFAGCADSVIGLGIIAAIVYVVGVPGSVAGRILNKGPLIWIGTLSYSLYLWQQLFLTPEAGATGMSAVVQGLPLNFVLAFAAGIGSFYLIERPMLRLRVKLFAEPGAGAGAGGPGI